MASLDIADLIKTGVCAPKSPDSNVGADWPAFARFGAFATGLGLRHFGPHEILFRGHDHVRGRCLNDYPPEALWPNITAAIRALDRLASDLGANVYVLSAYRSPAYNARVAGADPDSPHTRFAAIDFFCDTGSPTAWARTLAAYRRKGCFSGGIGTYPLFVHLDADGVDRDWTGH